MDRLNSQKKLKELIDGIPGGIGIFDFFLDGTINLVYLNEGYYELIGSRREDRTEYEGMSAIEAIPQNMRPELKNKIWNAINGDGHFSIIIPNQGIVGQEKWLQLNGKIVERFEDKVVFNVTYTDVTDYERTTRELEQAHAEIQIAADKVGILYWVYKVKEHQTIITKGKGYGYDKVIDNVPECFRGTGDVHPEEEALYLNLFEQMRKGVDSCECYARIYNHILKMYQWQHIVFTKLSENRYVGSAIDASEQKRAEQQYNNEITLRHELLKESVLSYQVNLSKGIVENKTTKYAEFGDKIEPFRLSKEKWDAGMSLFTDEKTKKEFEDKFLIDSLLEAWDKGITTVSYPSFQLKLSVGLKWFSTTATMLKRPGSGDIIAVIYTTDITQREINNLIIKKLFEKQYEAVNIINCINETYSLIQFDYNKEYVNPTKSMKYIEGIEQFASKYIAEEDYEYYKKEASLSNIKERLECDGGYSITFHMKSENEIKPLKKFTYYYLDDSHESILTVAEDITEIARKEQENVEKMRNAMVSVEQATEAKTAFFANISHDMRTPLNGVLGFTELGLDAETIEAKNECFEKIKSSGDFLLQLINDTLDMSKIESGSMILQPELVSTDETIQGIINTISRSAEDKNITLKVHLADEIIGKNMFVDKMRLQQVFVNLLGNAVKFTSSGGEIIFTFTYLKNAMYGANYKITVEDNGMGMQEDFIPYAFDAYTQQNTASTKQIMGTGLGLAVVKQIVTMMNGHIELKSIEGKGTLFDIYLFLDIRDKDSEEVFVKEKEINLNGKRILLCEDHPINRELAVRLLKKKGIKAVCAENGRVGLDIFCDSKIGYFNAILMDIRMPEMDGLETTKAIRHLGRADAKTIPIIAMTANAFDSDRKLSEEAGMNRHISKPIIPAKLYSVLLEEIG